MSFFSSRTMTYLAPPGDWQRSDSGAGCEVAFGAHRPLLETTAFLFYIFVRNAGAGGGLN